SAVLTSASGATTEQDVYQCAATCTAAPLDLGSEDDQLTITFAGAGLRNIEDLSTVRITIGGFAARVHSVYPDDQNPGVDQITLLVPRGLLGAGEVPVVLTAAGQTANVVTISLK